MREEKIEHPYMALENSTLWKTIEGAINDLIENQDLKLQTRGEYIIGYICKAIKDKQRNFQT